MRWVNREKRSNRLRELLVLIRKRCGASLIQALPIDLFRPTRARPHGNEARRSDMKRQ
jgi:hypothetical protein